MLQWYNWLYEMKKKSEEKKKEVEPQKLVSRVIRSAEGIGFMHKITEPTAWRGGVQILKEEVEDAKPLARRKDKKKEWTNHWQCDTKVQDLVDKP